MKKRLAKITSAVLNPFLVSLVVIVILAFQSTSGIFAAVKWALVSLAFSILPVFLVIISLVHNDKLEGISIKVRQKRNGIYLLASTCAVFSCFILYYLGAPLVLVAAFVSGLLSIVIFMCINLLWKISIHSAFVAGAITILVILYGYIWAMAALLLPLLGWSRIELEHHSPAQVVTGALLSAVVVTLVFYFFGLVGHVGAV